MTERADLADQTAGAGIGPAGDGTSGFGSAGQGAARITLLVLVVLTLGGLVWVFLPEDDAGAGTGQLASAEESFSNRSFSEALISARQADTGDAAPAQPAPAEGDAAAEAAPEDG
ncbi:MAG: hypothetical protein ABL308_07035 [Oceanicaulis sp.]